MGNKFNAVLSSNVSEAQTNEYYRPAITCEEHRIALNSLTRQCIKVTRAKKERLRFTSKGVDALGTAKRYLQHKTKYGENDPRTLAAERVFDYDVMTGLFEETETVHHFSVSYPVENNKVVMGMFNWEDIAANGLLDDSTDKWYQQRAFAEAREAVLTSQLLAQGLLSEFDIITISNTSTAQNADEYFSGEDLMIRRISFDKLKQTVDIDQLKMSSLDNAVVQQLFDLLGVQIDERTVSNSEDSSAKYLATQIKVKKGELLHGSADIGFLLDYIACQYTGEQHLFGKIVGEVQGNPYADVFKESRDKERRRSVAIEALKQDFMTLAASGEYNKDKIRKMYQDARSRVADIEGRKFVLQRYGEQAAKDFDAKQTALNKGDWAGADNAEATMQSSMGSVVICNTVFGSEDTRTSNKGSAFELFCPRLPKPGEVAQCPCCRKRVIVAGTIQKISCTTANCALEDKKLRRKRLNNQKKSKVENQKPKNFKIFDFSRYKQKVAKREKIAA